MKEITKERADELDAAWQAATDTQRLSMNRMSWFAADTTTYFEETPSKLELKAAARIAELEAALRKIADMDFEGPMHLREAEAASVAQDALDGKLYSEHVTVEKP